MKNNSPNYKNNYIHIDLIQLLKLETSERFTTSDLPRFAATLHYRNVISANVEFSPAYSRTVLTTRQDWISTLHRQTVKFTNTSVPSLLSHNPDVLHVMRMRERRSVTCDLRRSYVITHRQRSTYSTDGRKTRIILHKFHESKHTLPPRIIAIFSKSYKYVGCCVQSE